MASFVEQVYQTYDWKVPKHIIKKPSKLPAIEKPLPGVSYNPAFDDHQELLRKAVEVEVEKERKELKLARSLPVPLTASAAAPIKDAWLAEMSSGLFDDHIRDDPLEEKFPLASVSVGRPVRIDTKTVHQRNREKIHKKKEAMLKAAKEKRIRDHELFR